MKRFSKFINTSLIALALLLASCGEDRTGEFIAKTEVDHWIEAQMQDIYLWYNEIPELETSYYFYPADEFFPMLLSSNDKFSYIEMLDQETASAGTKSIHINSTTYGIEFVLTNDPTQTTSHQYARILYVLKNSPAARAGLKRGDWITTINSKNLTQDNYGLLETGNGVTVTIAPIILNEQTVSWGEATEIQIQAAEPMENNPFLVSEIITSPQSGKKTGYLVYNEFATGKTPNDPTDTSYLEEMKTIFQNFKNEGVDNFILDLRYNNGGYIQCAQAMATMLAPASSLNGEFAHLVHNDKRQDLNRTYMFDSNYSNENLNLSKLYVISGVYTASSSELIINSLRPYMDVKLLGVQTVGKNVAATQINSPYNFIMYPITATVYNKDNQSDYANGFTPDYTINELNYLNWAELGDTNELLLYNTLYLIEYGIAPDAENSESSGDEESGNENATKAVRHYKSRQALQYSYSSISQKTRPAIIATQH